MNHFKTIPVGTNPMILVACTALAFGVTHFHFNEEYYGGLVHTIGQILLTPAYLFDEISHFLNINCSSHVVCVFFSLVTTYSLIALTFTRLFRTRKVQN